jgi:glycosyltransferase involved in cell wall biosynthesis
VTDTRLVTVVAPVLDEEQVVVELVRRVGRTFDTEPYALELLVVDDGSTDATWDILRGLTATEPRLTLLRLSRSFGHQAALSAGIEAARGDAVVCIDGDLQDPPEVIPALLRRWEDGFDVVYGVRATREGETRFKRWTARIFYRVLRRMAAVEIPPDAGDFRLLSRSAADALVSMPERARFLRGMTSWVGFRQVGVEYDRAARGGGSTKYPFRKMLRFATDGVTSFSTVPLRILSWIGLWLVVLCALYLAFVLYKRVFTDDTVAGWASVVGVVVLIGGVQLLSLGMIGQYVARIYDEVKQRPLYVVSERLPATSEARDSSDASLSS